MLKFIIGVFVGAIIYFAICAICTIAGIDDRTDEQCAKNLGDSDAGKITLTELFLLIGIVAAFFPILLLFGLVSFINDFCHKLRCINCEINRTSGSERRYWIRKRRRLWLSLIPFVKC